MNTLKYAIIAAMIVLAGCAHDFSGTASQVADYDNEIGASPLTMAQLKTDIENLVKAAASANRGSAAPTNPFEGMLWWDSSVSGTETLKEYTGATYGWRTVCSVVASSGLITIGGVEFASNGSALVEDTGATTSENPFDVTIPNLSDNGTAYMHLGLDTTTPYDSAMMSFYLSTSGDQANNVAQFGVNGAHNALRINGYSNVGIGTAPAGSGGAKLTVDGDIIITQANVIHSGSASGYYYLSGGAAYDDGGAIALTGSTKPGDPAHVYFLSDGDFVGYFTPLALVLPNGTDLTVTGDTAITGSLSYGGTALTATAAEVNTAADGAAKTTVNIGSSGDIASGELKLTRVADVVTLKLDDIVYSGSMATASSAAGLIPSGYRPTVPGATNVVSCGSGSVTKVFVSYDGTLTISSYDWTGLGYSTLGVSLAFMTYTTEP